MLSIDPKYSHLAELLIANNWKEADQETTKIILQITGSTGVISFINFENLTCEDLHIIDLLWVKHSNGRFGFSIQQKIWLECGGKMDWETKCLLCDCLGWRKDGKWLDFSRGRYLHYDYLTSNPPVPNGYLPAEFLRESIGSICREFLFWKFFSYVKDCGI